MKKFTHIAIVATLLALPVFAVPAVANEGDDTPVSNDATTQASPRAGRLSDERKAEIREKVKARVQGRLDEVKKQVCERRVGVIEKIMDNAANMGARHLATFDRILQRVQDFYASKNLSVGNYDELVFQAIGKKTIIQTMIRDLKNEVNFDCNGDNPVAAIDAFNGKVRAMHQALKEYRTAIKDLLVAVKQAAEAAEGEQN